MIALLFIAGTCWLCALLAIPRKPLPGNETQELVYRRLIGRHQLLVALAFAVTLVTCCGMMISLFAQVAKP